MRTPNQKQTWLAVAILLVCLTALAAAANRPAVLAETVGTNAPAPLLPHLQVAITPRLQDVAVGGTASLNVTITNDGGAPLRSIQTSNASISSCNKNDLGSLNPGESTSYSCQASGVSESSLQTITASAQLAGGGSVSQTSDAFIRVAKPEIAILKRPEVQTVRRGGTANFTIVIFNTSPTAVLTNVKVLDSAVPDCAFDPAVPLTLLPSQSYDYACRLSNVQKATTSVATVQATIAGSGAFSQASDVAWVNMIDLKAALTSVPAAVPEPGGEVEFTATVTNPGSTPLKLVGLSTNKFGNLFDPGNEMVPAAGNQCLLGAEDILVPPNNGSVSCTFVALVAGQPSDFTVVLTATAEITDLEDISATGSTTVTIADVPAILALNLSADPSIIPAPGRTIQFNLRADNAGEADNIVIEALTDDDLGDLNGVGTCEVPTSPIAPGGFYECQYSAFVGGSANEQKVRTVTATGVDDDPTPGPVEAADSITITISDQPLQKVWLPQVIDDVVEPNNTCSRAYLLQLNRQYYFLPPPTWELGADPPLQDYFRFVLEEQADLSVNLTNFVPKAGQLIVRKGECGNVTLVGFDVTTAANKNLRLGTQSPGQYFIQIINDGPPEPKQLYGLIVRTE